MKILIESRKLRRAGDGKQTATIDGVKNVPLVKVQTKHGTFTKDEMASARTIARRMLKSEKQEKVSTGSRK